MQLVLFGNKAILANQTGDLAALSGSGRHLHHAFRMLGIAAIVALGIFLVLLSYLFFFDGFDRGGPY
jgi:hypothetical protein